MNQKKLKKKIYYKNVVGIFDIVKIYITESCNLLTLLVRSLVRRLKKKKNLNNRKILINWEIFHYFCLYSLSFIKLKYNLFQK